MSGVSMGRPLQIPYFNAPIFLENKAKVGKVDEIFGKTTDVVWPQRLLC
jgi:rRNA processing protein Gar1